MYSSSDVLQGRLYITTSKHLSVDYVRLELVGTHKLHLKDPQVAQLAIQSVPEATQVRFQLPLYSRMTVLLPGKSCLLFQFPCSNLPASFNNESNRCAAYTSYELTAEIATGDTASTDSKTIEIRCGVVRGWVTSRFDMHVTRFHCLQVGQISCKFRTLRRCYSRGQVATLVMSQCSIVGTHSLTLLVYGELERVILMSMPSGKEVKHVEVLSRWTSKVIVGKASVGQTDVRLPETICPQSFGASLSCWYQARLRLSVRFGNQEEIVVPIQVVL